MNKKLSILLLLSVIFLSGCANKEVTHGNDCQCSTCYMEMNTAKTSQFMNAYKVDSYSDIVNNKGLHELVDPDTGVHYLLYNDCYGATITPMYNSDGAFKTN